MTNKKFESQKQPQYSRLILYFGVEIPIYAPKYKTTLVVKKSLLHRTIIICWKDECCFHKYVI